VKELLEKLARADGLWIAWPKKTARLDTDLDKSCSIDERWQALRFVYRLADR
jgi:hypothetical protein